jgi:hypothetical protein
LIRGPSAAAGGRRVRALWIWVAALLAYGVFWLWYVGWRSPLTPAEVERFAAALEAPALGTTPEQVAAFRAFLASDDGREFHMLNLLRLQPDGALEPETGERRPAREVLESYTGEFMRALFRRAGHPALLGWSAGGYVESWGVEPNPGWGFAGVIRYRSRRDVAELATDPRFARIHAYKLAALANTLAFPLAPGFVVVGPRVVVALALALAAALAQLALRSGR